MHDAEPGKLKMAVRFSLGDNTPSNVGVIPELAKQVVDFRRSLPNAIFHYFQLCYRPTERSDPDEYRHDILQLDSHHKAWIRGWSRLPRPEGLGQDLDRETIDMMQNKLLFPTTRPFERDDELNNAIAENRFAQGEALMLDALFTPSQEAYDGPRNPLAPNIPIRLEIEEYAETEQLRLQHLYAESFNAQQECILAAYKGNVRVTTRLLGVIFDRSLQIKRLHNMSYREALSRLYQKSHNRSLPTAVFVRTHEDDIDLARSPFLARTPEDVQVSVQHDLGQQALTRWEYMLSLAADNPYYMPDNSTLMHAFLQAVLIEQLLDRGHDKLTGNAVSKRVLATMDADRLTHWIGRLKNASPDELADQLLATAIN